MTLGGSIVNISSVHALETTPHVAPYAAAKAALLSLTRSTAIEGRARGIRANAILPGAIDTDALGKSEHQIRGRNHQPGRCRQAGADCRSCCFSCFRRRRLCQRRGAQRGWRPVGAALDVQAVLLRHREGQVAHGSPAPASTARASAGNDPALGGSTTITLSLVRLEKGSRILHQAGRPDSTARALRRHLRTAAAMRTNAAKEITRGATGGMDEDDRALQSTASAAASFRDTWRIGVHKVRPRCPMESCAVPSGRPSASRNIGNPI